MKIFDPNNTFAENNGLDEFEDEAGPFDPNTRHQLAMKRLAGDYGFKKDVYTQYQVGMILSRFISDLHMNGYHMDDTDRIEANKLPPITEEEFEVLKPFGLLLACLQGNAFPQLVLQYCKDAKYFLINNGWWDDIKDKGLNHEFLSYENQMK